MSEREQTKMDSRYTGPHGTENRLDDYFFGPIFLLGILAICIFVGGWLFEGVGLALGLFIGLAIDIHLIKTEWRLRQGNAEGSNER